MFKRKNNIGTPRKKPTTPFIPLSEPHNNVLRDTPKKQIPSNRCKIDKAHPFRPYMAHLQNF